MREAQGTVGGTNMRTLFASLVGAALLLGACAPAEVTQSDLTKGLQAIKEGRLPAAEQHFNAALAEDPNDPYANLNLGMVKARTGRREEAIGHYQLAIANGEGKQIVGLVRPGSTDEEAFEGDVADVARRNLEKLGV